MYDEEESEDIFTGKPGDELTYLFRAIFKNRIAYKAGVSLQIFWNALMDNYLKDVTNGIPANGKDRSSARGNLNKSFRCETMTWKIFKCALKFLGAHSVRIELRINWGESKYNDVETIHHVIIPIRKQTFVSKINDSNFEVKVSPMTISLDQSLNQTKGIAHKSMVGNPANDLTRDQNKVVN